MKRVIGTILSFVVAAVVILFIVSNRASVPVSFWPLFEDRPIPIWLFFLLGFLLGLAIAWYLGVVRRIKSHAERRRAEKRAADLEGERNELEARIDVQEPEIPLDEPRPDVPLLAPGDHKD